MAEVSRRSIVYDILFNVEKGKLSAKQAEAQLKGLEKQATATGSTINKMGTTMGAAFGLGAFGAVELTRQLALVAKESIQLALKAEGVKRAFVALNNANLLSDLRKATRGTVDDLTLMQTAVRADKFKIPLDQLAKLLKFAQVRARETGQSVEFLTNSIVDGIGRKSPLILDNLGLSAAAISEEFKRTGDFATAVGNIIESELGKAGEAGDTAADRIERFNTSITNLKLAFGELLIKATPAIEVLTTQIQSFTDASTLSKLAQMQLSIFGLGGLFGGLRDSVKDASDEMKAFEPPKWFSELAKLAKPVQAVGTTVADLNQQIDELRLLQQGLNIDTDEGIATYRDYDNQIKKIETRIKSLTEANVKLNESFKNISSIGLVEHINSINIETEKFIALVENGIGKLSTGELAQLSGSISNVEGAITSAKGEAATFAEVMIDNQQKIQDSSASIFTQSLELIGQQKAAALAQIGINQAVAISEAVKDAQVVGITPVEKFGIYLAMIAQILGGIAQAKAVLSQSQGFAEGVIDLHRPGETKGKDSIPATLMPGESVMTTEETRKYKPFLKAIRSDNFEEFIMANYVDPALAVAGLEHAIKDSRQMDYSDRFYKQLLATNEHIGTSKRQTRLLKSIDEKLDPKPYLKRYLR